MPRFSAVVSLVLGTFLLAASSAQAARPLDLPNGKPLLFAVQADEGSFERIGRARYVLTLRGVASQGLWFTDRPGRDTGALRVGPFFGAWRALGFGRVPPNAVLALPSGRRRANAVAVELGAPRWNARTETVSFRVRALRSVTGGLAHLDDDLDARVPARFRAASLFIDDVLVGSVNSQCSSVAQLDLYPTSGPLPNAYLEPFRGQLLPIMQHTALFALLGDRFGGDGRVSFALPNPAAPTGLRYGVCEHGIWPSRSDMDPGGRAYGCTDGTLALQAQQYAPVGWLPADGRTVRVSDWPQLFAAIGTAFGGDGRITFAVPRAAVPDGLAYNICANGDRFQPGQPTADTCTMSELAPFATRGVPSNFLPADGRTLQIRDAMALYAILGTSFGGDGETTFNLPNLPGPAPGTTYGICSDGIWPS